MYNRVLVKVSGEVFGGGRHGLDYDAVTKVAYQISQAKELGVEIGVVVGGGNIIRGIDAQTHGVERATADYMGMLATVINALALQSMLEQKFGYDVRTQTAVPVHAVAEDFIQRVAIGHLEKKRIVIFAGGTGNPFFSTDTAAVLRAIEINADIMIKATKVDGVYDKDPKKFSDAVKYDELSYMSVLKQQLKVLDATAISLCMDNNLPVQVLDIFEEGNIRHAIEGRPVGTMIK
ncbi:MAG: UMP kinase [Spirochaetes bacterium GWF1_49_6]|nr:MAG: UMP kinase [Spirochaetes bacterium GWF1_49_6]